MREVEAIYVVKFHPKFIVSQKLHAMKLKIEVKKDLKRRGGIKGQGQNQVPEVRNHRLESTNPDGYQRDISDDIFAINDSVFSVVISNDTSYTCAYPGTCQNLQLTIGQPKTTKGLLWLRKKWLWGGIGYR